MKWFGISDFAVQILFGFRFLTVTLTFHVVCFSTPQRNLKRKQKMITRGMRRRNKLNPGVSRINRHNINQYPVYFDASSLSESQSKKTSRKSERLYHQKLQADYSAHVDGFTNIYKSSMDPRLPVHEPKSEKEPTDEKKLQQLSLDVKSGRDFVQPTRGHVVTRSFAEGGPSETINSSRDL